MRKKSIVGVMPNAAYQEHIYDRDGFCALSEGGKFCEEERREQT